MGHHFANGGVIVDQESPCTAVRMTVDKLLGLRDRSRRDRDTKTVVKEVANQWSRNETGSEHDDLLHVGPFCAFRKCSDR